MDESYFFASSQRRSQHRRSQKSLRRLAINGEFPEEWAVVWTTYGQDEFPPVANPVFEGMRSGERRPCRQQRKTVFVDEREIRRQRATK